MTQAQSLSPEQTRARLLSAARTYFDGLAARDMSHVPWHESVIFRGPLAPGFPEPVVGRAAVLEWFSSLYPALGKVEVIDHYWNESLTSLVTRADVHITKPACVLRVVDRFTVDREGQITEQENHYDPRAALQAADQ